uniref:Uncharacterized protein n=1 Tax=Physcomitrium patens TaxID=3218 RepID=A9SQC1_PHYPA|nr:uncharacterized protein LOC112283325 [Physcomitrium patens]XP_024377655.1 uncharacterized protein LOC112283325 [Physcomitrium patens]XP_024377657.1 uncharacterized protein LOC112283325 [Physcomitrium patens]PNR52958.1 hypothetical protein PHYPA_009333 [Physcomitrium patens]|eukprot:XP_024377654.1 uncharacterized protein LOC112283325 [Physcomitrella patens]
MARVSTASTEADFLPAMVPFDWESAPGRPAKQSMKKSACDGDAFAKRDIEPPSLQLPPGQRPKDGFYLPYSRPMEYPKLQNEEHVKVRGIVSRAREWFSLKVPECSSKTSTPLKSFKPPWIRKEGVHSCASIFNPLSGNKIVSRITRRMLVEFQKKQSSLRRCLPSKLGSENQKKGHPSHDDPNRGRRLDSADEEYVTAADSSTLVCSLRSSPCHDHRHVQNSSVVAPKQSQVVASSRFMATMLMSLCSEADEVHAAAVHGTENKCSDENRLSQSTSRRGLSTSSESIVATPLTVPDVSEIVMDQASETILIREKIKYPAPIIAEVHLPTLPVADRKNRSESLQKELGKDGQPFENSRSGKLAPSSRHQSEDYAETCNRKIVPDHKDVANEHTLISKASPGRRVMRTRGPCNASFSWKSCGTQGQLHQESFSTLVESHGQESGNSDFVKDIFEDAREEYERRSSYSSLVRNYSTGSSSSSSPEHEVVRRRPDSLSAPIHTYKVAPVAVSEPGNALGSIRCQSNAEQSHMIDHSLEERSEWEKRHATTAISSHLHPMQKQGLQQGTGSGRIRIREMRAPISTNIWKEVLISSPLWPALSKAHAASGDDNKDESDWLSDSISTDSSEYETPSAISHPPLVSSPARCNSPSPRPATRNVSKNLLESSQLHQSELLQQQSHSESPPTASVMAHHGSPTGRSSGFQEGMATSHSFSCRTYASGVTFATPEYPTESVVFEGPDLAPVSRFARTSTSTVMSKLAQWEAGAGAGSSSKSLPTLLSRRSIAKCSTTTSTPVTK